MATPPGNPGSYPMETAQRQRTFLVRIVRMAFFIIIITIAILNAPQATAGQFNISWWWPILIALFLVGIALTVDLATPNKKIAAISGVFFGIFAGMLATIALTSIMELLLKNWLDPKFFTDISPFIQTVRFLLGITLCYLGITTVLQTQDDFRLVIPYVEFAKDIRGPKPLLLDTSILIDARIVDLGNTGLLQAPIVIPHFVVAELQILADSQDRMKRAKGRRGLDVIGRLQRAAVLDVTIDETPVAGKNVDQMLVELARRMPATIITSDVALARIAQIQGVTILNLNDVANALKPALIPGEQLTVRPIKPGEQPGQGVGYLEDGTMIVVEQGADRIGQDTLVEVSSSLQTSAGRLIFARPVPPSGGPNTPGPEARVRSASGDSGVRPAIAPTPDPLPRQRSGDSGIRQAITPTPDPLPPLRSPGDSAIRAAINPTPDPIPASAAQPTSADQPVDHPNGDTPADPAPSDQPGGPDSRPGPFPPKPPSRTTTGRNPRR